MSKPIWPKKLICPKCGASTTYAIRFPPGQTEYRRWCSGGCGYLTRQDFSESKQVKP